MALSVGLQRKKIPLKKASPPKVSEPKKPQDMIPVVVEKKVTQPANITKKQRKQLESMFGESSDTIISFIDMNDQDSAHALIYKALLKTLVEVLTLAESNIRATEGARGIYGFNQLVSQMRELMVDIQSQQDKSAMVRTIIEKILIPSFTDIGMQINYAMTQSANLCKSSLSDVEFARIQPQLTQITEGMGRFLSDSYRKAIADVNTAFV